MAPPSGLSRSGSAPVSASQASGTGAKASLTSKTPISAKRQPGLAQHLLGGRDRAGEHQHRVGADDRAGAVAHERRQAELARPCPAW